MTLNRKQREALWGLFERSTVRKGIKNPSGMTYRQFRRTVYPMFMEPQVAMVPFCGMIVGIEPDGYTHS